MSQFKSHIGKIDAELKSPQGQVTGYRIVENKEKYYIAHLGDIATNENLLYDIRDHKPPGSLKLETFSIGDEVEFEPFGEITDAQHAIHVKKCK